MSERQTPGQTAWDLASRPGFLIRRLHQIHVALFLEECGDLGLTPVQFSVLTAVAETPGLEQARLTEKAGVDRTTLAGVVARLEKQGFVRRRPRRSDRRVKQVLPTSAGLDLLARMEAPARRAHARTIEAMPAAERQRFLQSLARLVEAGNAYGRAALRLS
jgi:DNA-binding MarR family transcriptional regulator